MTRTPGQHSTTSPTAPAAPAATTGAEEPNGSLWRDGFGRVATRSAQALLLIALIAVAMVLLVTLKLVTLPLLIALIIASAMSPVVRWLRRVGFRPVWAAITCLLGIILALGAIISGIAATVSKEAPTLAQKATQGFTQVTNWLGRMGVPLDDSHLDEYLTTGTEWLKTHGTNGAMEGVSVVSELLTGGLLMIVMLFFFLLDGDRMWAFLMGWLPDRLRNRTNAAGRASVDVLGKYIRGTVIIAAFAAVVDCIAMFVVKVPLAIPLAAMIFLGAFIPIVGALVTGMFAALVALVAGGPMAALVLVIVVIVVNQIEHHILQPKVMGTALSLHGIVIISALAIGAHQGGVAGALLAVPVTAVLWASIKVFQSMRGESQTVPGPDPDEGPEQA